MAAGKFKGNPERYGAGTAKVKTKNGTEYERRQYRRRSATSDADARFDAYTATPAPQDMAEPVAPTESVYVPVNPALPSFMGGLIEAHHGPDAADEYRARVAGTWVDQESGDERRKDLMAIAAMYERRSAEGRDLLTGRDELGFDEFGVNEAGFLRDGSSAFGQRVEHERTRTLLDERGFRGDGKYRDTGGYRNKVGTDQRGFCQAEDGSGVWPAGTRINLLTQSPFTPPPSEVDWNGWNRKGRRRGPNNVWETHPNYPAPYFV